LGRVAILALKAPEAVAPGRLSLVRGA